MIPLKAISNTLVAIIAFGLWIAQPARCQPDRDYRDDEPTNYRYSQEPQDYGAADEAITYVNASTLEIGTKIRIKPVEATNFELDSEGYLTGFHVSMVNGILTMSVGTSGGPLFSAPTARISEVQVYRGKGKSPLIGAVAGGVIGIGIAVSEAEKTTGTTDGFGPDFSDGYADAGNGLGIVLISVLAGFTLGTILGSDTWDNIVLPYGSSSQVGQTSHDYRLSYAIRF